MWGYVFTIIIIIIFIYVFSRRGNGESISAGGVPKKVIQKTNTDNVLDLLLDSAGTFDQPAREALSITESIPGHTPAKQKLTN